MMGFMSNSTNTEADRRAELWRMIGDGRATAIRRSAGLSLAMVARSVGADHTAVSRWERGQRRPTGAAALNYYALLKRLDKAAAS